MTMKELSKELSNLREKSEEGGGRDKIEDQRSKGKSRISVLREK